MGKTIKTYHVGQEDFDTLWSDASQVMRNPVASNVILIQQRILSNIHDVIVFVNEDRELWLVDCTGRKDERDVFVHVGVVHVSL